MAKWIKGLVAGACLLSLGGCISAGGQWGDSRWPGMGDVGVAAKEAAMEPGTWVPLLGAAVLMIEDADAQATEWAQREQPLFGDDANGDSDDLLDLAGLAYVTTALLAPSDSWQDKVAGLSVGAATIVVEGVVSKGLKRTFNRERPNGRNDFSLPSGHAGRSAAFTRLSMENLAAFDLSPSQRIVGNVGLHLLSAGSSWARVESGKHHFSDVFVGYGLGNFIAAFMQRAFFKDSVNEARVSYVPLENGGAVTFTRTLH